jgi:predicted Zn finger-like uncharacterized protein
MIIICQKCSSRLQVDETKIPTRPFIIRCPKCNSSVDSGGPSPAVEQSSTAVGNSPSTKNPRFDQPTPAPLFELQQQDTEASSGASATERLAELLSGLLNQPASAGRGLPNARRSWDPRKALVCVPEGNRELVAGGLAENGYQVFVAQDTRQAVDRMRENQLDVVLLDSRFDPAEQGVIFVTREVNILRPPQRRRLFFVLLSPSLRTMDAHTAFLTNVNAIVNINEIEELPKLLERRVREYNELYKEFNSALGVPAL